MDALTPLMTPAEVAEILRRSPDTIQDYAMLYAASNGKFGLRGIRVGNCWRFNRDDVARAAADGVPLRRRGRVRQGG